MRDGYKRLTLKGSKENINTAIAKIRNEAVKDDAYFAKPNKINPERRVLTPAKYDAQGNEISPATFTEDYFATIIVRNQAQLTIAQQTATKSGINFEPDK